MKFIAVILLLASTLAYSGTEATCEVVNGIYQNSSESIQDIKFETLVDVFTLNNAKTLSFSLNHQNLKLLRSQMDIGRQTKMIYLQKKSNGMTRIASLMLDRTPRDVAKTKEFYGNMILSSEIHESEIARGNRPTENFVYNFFCRF